MVQPSDRRKIIENMSLYSIDKLIDETRRLAAEFRRTTGTMLPVSGEIARHDVSRHLNLTVTQDNSCGYDAIGNDQWEGLRILIKSRVVGDTVKSSHRLGQLNTNGDWDLVALSLMDNEFEPLEIYMARREDILDAMAKTSDNRNKRGAISVSKFRMIGELVWTREHGIDEQACCK